MATLRMRDVSRAGVELGRAELDDLPTRCTVVELLRRRVAADVAGYEADPGTLFRGLVSPEDAVRHSDGFHLPAPRALDVGALTAAAEAALRAGLLRVQAGDEVLADADDEIDVDAHDEVVILLQRSVIARGA